MSLRLRFSFVVVVGIAVISLPMTLWSNETGSQQDSVSSKRTWENYTPTAFNSETWYLNYLQSHEIVDRNGSRDAVLQFIETMRPKVQAQQESRNAGMRNPAANLPRLREESRLLRDEFWAAAQTLLPESALTQLKKDFVRSNLLGCVTGDSAFMQLAGITAERGEVIRRTFVTAAMIDAETQGNRDVDKRIMDSLTESERASLLDLGVLPE